VVIHTEAITVGALLKWARVVATGGEAKELVRRGRVRVNGQVERRRGRRVRPGDVVEVGSAILEIRRGLDDADASAPG
jgi:ribosome-associated protein